MKIHVVQNVNLKNICKVINCAHFCVKHHHEIEDKDNVSQYAFLAFYHDFYADGPV